MKLDNPSAAARLGISPKTLENWRSAGSSPPFFKVGARVLYDVADLDAWLAARRRTSTARMGMAAVS